MNSRRLYGKYIELWMTREFNIYRNGIETKVSVFVDVNHTFDIAKEYNICVYDFGAVWNGKVLLVDGSYPLEQTIVAITQFKHTSGCVDEKKKMTGLPFAGFADDSFTKRWHEQ